MGTSFLATVVPWSQGSSIAAVEHSVLGCSVWSGLTSEAIVTDVGADSRVESYGMGADSRVESFTIRN